MQENNIRITNQIIRLKELVAMTGLSRSSIYDRMSPKSPRFDSSFPPKINLGLRAVGWFLEDVETWLNSMRSNSLSERAS
jgi:prophage regulatory protein